MVILASYGIFVEASGRGRAIVNGQMKLSVPVVLFKCEELCLGEGGKRPLPLCQFSC
jgi:hypothetical protein